MKIVHDYKDNIMLRLSFSQLANSVFGIDFENYYKSGFWKERYVCHSYVDNGKVVSNVSTSFLDIILNGERIRAVQIGTVMTHPEYRSNGLAKSLMHYVLDKYEDCSDLIYLFANNTVLDFYPKFGFKPVKESKFVTEVKIRNCKDKLLRKLNISNKEDLNLIIRLADERKPVSRIFGVENAQSLLLFYCLYVYSDNIYYLEDLDVIVLLNIEGKDLHIYDLISREDIVFENILNKIAFSEIDKVIFHYTPDYKDIEVKSIPREGHCDVFFVRSKTVEIPDFLKYPDIAHS